MLKNIVIIILFILYEYKKKYYLLKHKLHYSIREFVTKIKEIIFNKKIPFNNYLNANKIKWQKIENNCNKSENKILISNFVGHPGYTLPECLLGKYLSKFSTFDTIGLLGERDFTGKKILKSFNINKFYIYKETN